MEIPVHGNNWIKLDDAVLREAQIDQYVWKFRDNRIPLGFVASVLGKDHRTVQRWAAANQIPGCRRHRRRKCSKGQCHFYIRHCPKFWAWLEQQDREREAGKVWKQAARVREVGRSVQLMIATEFIVMLKRASPDKQFTEHDFPEARDYASRLAREGFGVMLERLPASFITKAGKVSRTEQGIAYKVLEWYMTDTMPKTGDEAGRRIWGDDSWLSYQASRRREFVRIFRKWKKQLQDTDWLPDKTDDERAFSVKTSHKALLGDDDADDQDANAPEQKKIERAAKAKYFSPEAAQHWQRQLTHTRQAINECQDEQQRRELIAALPPEIRRALGLARPSRNRKL